MKATGKIIILWLLILTLIITTLSSCSTPTTTTTTVASAPATSAPATSAPATSAPVASAPTATAVSAKDFGLENIPEIKNKNPLNLALEIGGTADTIMPFIKKFSDATGIICTAEQLPLENMYDLEKAQMTSKDLPSAYDLVTLESSWSNDWKDYFLDMRALADQYDPAGSAGYDADLKNYDPGLLRANSTADGKLLGIPYYQYTMIGFYRKDIFEDPTEKAAFKAKYGYELVYPQTVQQEIDMAQFFTRKKGENLMGKPLDKDFYGISLMAGAQPHVQDEIGALIWAQGGQFVDTVKNTDGTVKEFVYTKKDQQAVLTAVNEYKELLKCADPIALNYGWDGAPLQFGAGNAAMMPMQYPGLWNWMVGMVEGNNLGKVAASVTPGDSPYTGSFFMLPPKNCKNPEAAYWFLKYFNSYKCQMELCTTGGWPTARLDVINDALNNSAITSAPDFNANWGMYTDALLPTWKLETPEVIGNIAYFNNDGFRKDLPACTDIFHNVAAGIISPQDAVTQWGEAMAAAQSSNSKIPLRIEQ